MLLTKPKVFKRYNGKIEERIGVVQPLSPFFKEVPDGKPVLQTHRVYCRLPVVDPQQPCGVG